MIRDTQRRLPIQFHASGCFARRRGIGFLAVALLSSLAATAPASAFAATFSVTNANPSGAGSLHAAITASNKTAGADNITFSIPGDGPHLIGGVLPEITDSVYIAGYSQPGATTNTIGPGATNADLRIVIDGSAAVFGHAVLRISATDTTVEGLVVRAIPPGGSGIRIGETAEDVTVRGCFVGVEAGGYKDRSAGTGILVLGRHALMDGNLVSGNDAAGIVLRADSCSVSASMIGTDANGSPKLGNGYGVRLSTAAAFDNFVGSQEEGSANLIAGNKMDGVRLDSDAGDGNRIGINSIHHNGGLGIDLGGDGVTPNDEEDADDGPNQFQNAPEIGFARVTDGILHVELRLVSTPGLHYVNLYASADADPGGYGEGETFLWEIFMTIPEGETETRIVFDLVLDLVPVDLPPAPFFTTATAQNTREWNTSEFSRAIEVLDGGAAFGVRNTNDSGSGSLRAAIDAADATPSMDTVVFLLNDSGPHTIALQSGLTIQSPLIIDGYTAAGSSPNARASGSDATITVDLDGSAIPFDFPVLAIFADDTLIRGLAIHDAPEDAIVAFEADRLAIQGCFIGTDVDGSEQRANAGAGIHTYGTTDVTIGGPLPGQRNVISGNLLDGLTDEGTATVVRNNLIGTDRAAISTIGNGRDGLHLAGNGATIGGDLTGEWNLIRGNARAGVGVASLATGNRVLGNRIVGNGSLGIDLNVGDLPEVTPNDADDEDGGGNLLQNFPVLTWVSETPDGFAVEGSLDVPDQAVNAVYTIRVFANSRCDASEHGEGSEFLGAVDVQLSGGAETFSFPLSVDAAQGEVFAATATEAGTGNTSEFSPCLREGVVPPPLCGDVSSNGAVTAADALAVLKAAVSAAACLPCVCDANDSGAITSSDALLVLRASVGQPVELTCPACN